MPNQNKKDSDASVLERLAGAGEDALTRLVDELGRNTRVTETLSRAMNAKDKVVSGVGQVGFSASGEVAELRERLEKLEKRLAKLEGTSGERRAPRLDDREDVRPRSGRSTVGLERARRRPSRVAGRRAAHRRRRRRRGRPERAAR